MFEVFEVAATLEVVEVPSPPAPPAPEILARVEALWSAEQRRRTTPLVNGRLFHVARRTAARLEGWFVEYRWWVAQLQDPEVFRDKGVRPLGVSGLTSTSAGVVMALRSGSMTLDAGQWELAPAGGVDPTARSAAGSIDVRAQFLDELEEELNLPPSTVAATRPASLIFSDATRCYDLVLEARLHPDASEVQARFARRAHHEYTDLRILPRAALPAFLAGNPVTAQSRKILEVHGWTAS